MRALRFHEHGRPEEALRLEQLLPPDPGPGEVRLHMWLRPINPSDLLQVEGSYGRKPPLPATAGLEGLGTVDALGPGVAGWRLGQRVLPLAAQGTWATFALAKAADLVAVPDAVPDEAACQALVNPLTAWLLLRRELAWSPGDWVVLTAAGSAVGRAAVQLARAWGLRTLALVRNPASAEGLGADATLATGDADWQERARDLVGEGAAGALDAVGGKLAGQVAALLRPGATLAVYGALSREPLVLGGGQLIFRSTTVKGFWLTDWKRRTDPELRAREVAGLMEALGDGTLRPSVAGRFPLEAYREAIAAEAAPGRVGKILLG